MDLFSGLDLGNFFAIFQKGDNFCDFLFTYCTQSPSEKEYILKAFLRPCEENSFLLE